MNTTYVQTNRAEKTRQTGERIMAAGLARFGREPYDGVTLDQIADDAGVTVQTVIRRFGSKEGLVGEIAQMVRDEVEAHRGDAAIGDTALAVDNLVDHYEQHGDLALHLLHQEDRVTAFAEVTAQGKQFHAAWCARVFAPWLDALAGAARQRRLAQVIAVCDVYTWYLLRRQRGLSARQTRHALTELLEGILR